jgi:hypothetical protein
MLRYNSFFLYLSPSVVKNGAVFDVTISCVCGYDEDWKNMDGQTFLKRPLSKPTSI